ncbi:MAG TPA: alanine racemase [Armatimonadota bacterium]|nr:alanine racemase [Armatimonadota bacterium]
MDRPLLETLDTPSAVINLPILENNLRRMADLCRTHGIALRPHAKTHKTVEIGQRQLALGAVGITLAKLGEAEVMALHGFDDILIAYQLIGPHKMARLTQLLQRPRETPLRLTVAVDSLEGATALSDAATRAGARLPVLIEIDTGLGRAGIADPEGALSLARHIQLFPGLRLAGVMTHEGQVGRDGPANMKERSAEAANRMMEIAGAIRSLGLECPIVSVGSTPGARFMAGAPGVTELRPGTYVFNDRTQILVGAAQEEDCALTVLSTVISVQPGGRAVIDAGSKTLTSDTVSRFGSYGEVIGDPEARLATCSEEHGHLDISQSTRRYRVGDRLHILPNHVCPVVNLMDRLYVYEGESITQEWTVAARGRIQ